MTNTEIELSREVEAIQIPSGDAIALPAGTKVIITQSLGGTHTVATEHGLARIAESEADALGLDDNQADADSPAGGAALEGEELVKAVWDKLKGVYDPEIPVNIVDLGLVYDCLISGEDNEKTADIKMTLTAPGCGMGPAIAADAQGRVVTLTGIKSANVELVWDPPWNQDMISQDGKMELGMI